jgi:hypothetical protein
VTMFFFFLKKGGVDIYINQARFSFVSKSHLPKVTNNVWKSIPIQSILNSNVIDAKVLTNFQKHICIFAVRDHSTVVIKETIVGVNLG